VFDASLIHKEKGRRDVLMTLVPDVSTTGAVCGVHCLCADITERKIVDDQNSRRFAISQRLARLTPDERTAYALMIQGHPNKFVALKLDISLRTAERRRGRILDKLDVDTLPELLQLLAEIQQVDTAQLPSTVEGSDNDTR
jgi:DNA-binding CsgD family transcriptional regulator